MNPGARFLRPGKHSHISGNEISARRGCQLTEVGNQHIIHRILFAGAENFLRLLRHDPAVDSEVPQAATCHETHLANHICFGFHYFFPGQGARRFQRIFFSGYTQPGKELLPYCFELL